MAVWCFADEVWWRGGRGGDVAENAGARVHGFVGL